MGKYGLPDPKLELMKKVHHKEVKVIKAKLLQLRGKSILGEMMCQCL